MHKTLLADTEPKLYAQLILDWETSRCTSCASREHLSNHWMVIIARTSPNPPKFSIPSPRTRIECDVCSSSSPGCTRLASSARRRSLSARRCLAAGFLAFGGSGFRVVHISKSNAQGQRQQFRITLVACYPQRQNNDSEKSGQEEQQWAWAQNHGSSSNGNTVTNVCLSCLQLL